MRKVILMIPCLLIAAIVSAQTKSVGENKFVALGNAEATYITTKGASSFGNVNFKPIFLWRISDKLFVEAETEIETGGGDVNLG